MQKPSVLVLATDESIEALLFDMLVHSGYRVLIRADDERAVEAIARLKPAVVLVDTEHGPTFEADVGASADEYGARVLLFSATHSQHELDAVSRAFGRTALALPLSHRELDRRLSP